MKKIKYSVSRLDTVHFGAGFDLQISYTAKISAKPAPTIGVPHSIEKRYRAK